MREALIIFLTTFPFLLIQIGNWVLLEEMEKEKPLF